MKIYDISVELKNKMISWPEELAFSQKTEKKNNDICVTEMMLSVHSGTHIDAPRHFIPNGKRISDYSLERFHGKTKICHIQDNSSITKDELLQKSFDGYDKILFKTANSARWAQNAFDRDFIGLSLPAAEHLVEIGVRLVGIDYLSIESIHSIGNRVHKLLLENDILILEGLDLSMITGEAYYLCCYPLKVKDAEASPVRALLQDI